MLTLNGKLGRAVAVVNGGPDDLSVIRICNPDAGPAEAPRRALEEVLDERDLKLQPQKYKAISAEARRRIAQALASGQLTLDSSESSSDDDAPVLPPVPKRVTQRRVMMARDLAAVDPKVGRRVARAYNERSANEFRLSAGKMVVLPDKQSERVFVAGASGSGKSFWTASYMREYMEMFPARRIFLFSTHDGEKAYEPLEHHAVALDETFAETPLTLDALSDSLCVFDDCDALQDRKLSKAVEALNLDLINNGRKYNIHVVTLSHVLMGYSKTRCQLIEANRVVLYPGGNDYHAKRWMKIYGGIPDKWGRAILEEKTRWVCFDMRMPRSFVTENAVVLIRGDGPPER